MGTYQAQLKQENEELRAELQAARERESKNPSASDRKLPNLPAAADDVNFEKNMFRQELQSLQVSDSLFTGG